MSLLAEDVEAEPDAECGECGWESWREHLTDGVCEMCHDERPAEHDAPAPTDDDGRAVNAHGRPYVAACVCCESPVTEAEVEDGAGLCPACLDAGEAECPRCGRWMSRSEFEDYAMCVRCYDTEAPR